MTCSVLIATVILGCMAKECSSFHRSKLVTVAKRTSLSTSSRHGASRDFLHEAEYPGDDFTHILGFSDCDHEPSKLQQIASNTLKDVTRNKTPVDTVSHNHILSSFLRLKPPSPHVQHNQNQAIAAVLNVTKDVRHAQCAFACTSKALFKFCSFFWKDGCGIDRSFYISASDMEQDIRDFDEKYGKPLNLGTRIASTSPKMAIAAEFKRASPSKGDINPGLDSVVQCMEYAKVGAAVISVLTEFKWFKGNR